MRWPAAVTRRDAQQLLQGCQVSRPDNDDEAIVDADPEKISWAEIVERYFPEGGEADLHACIYGIVRRDCSDCTAEEQKDIAADVALQITESRLKPAKSIAGIRAQIRDLTMWKSRSTRRSHKREEFSAEPRTQSLQNKVNPERDTEPLGDDGLAKEAAGALDELDRSLSHLSDYARNQARRAAESGDGDSIKQLRHVAAIMSDPPGDIYGLDPRWDRVTTTDQVWSLFLVLFQLADQAGKIERSEGAKAEWALPIPSYDEFEGYLAHLIAAQGDTRLQQEIVCQGH
jgi:hypothetical protein